jgi:hypothetical protein
MLRSISRIALVAATAFFSGCFADATEESDSTSSAISLTATEIRYAAFIPCQAVGSPEPGVYYGGDGRSFDYAAAPNRSRIYMQAKVDPNSAAPTSTTQRIGRSHWYRSSSIAGAGTGACYKTTASAASAGSATASDENVRTTVSHPSANVTQLHMEMHAKNPLFSLGAAPDIDSVVDIFIEYSVVGGKKVPQRYRWKGWHDGFPAYELYINGQPIRTYDPIAAGRGPGSLFPGNAQYFQGAENASAF